MDPFASLSLTLFAIALLLVLMGVRSVPQGHEYAVERFGRYVRGLGPGSRIIEPFVEPIIAKLKMMGQVLDVPSQQAIVRDKAVVTVGAIVFFQVLDTTKAAYEVRELSSAILNLTSTNMRTANASMGLDELLSRRDDIDARLLAVVDEATRPWGVKVTPIEIEDITPPQDPVDAMARQMKAERAKGAAVLQAWGERQAAILEAEGEKQAAILEVEDRREAAFRDAKAREPLAEAEAWAAAMLSEAIAEGSPLAVNYFVAEKYQKALETIGTSRNQKTLVLPVEALRVLGSLAGIAELAREACGRPGGPRRAARGPTVAYRGATSLVSPQPWDWWLVGGLPVLLEAVAPGFVPIWLGLAVLATGSVLSLMPELARPWQISLFSLLDLVSADIWPARRRAAATEPEESSLNRRAEARIGLVVALVEPILDGRGKVRIGDTLWLASGPDQPARRRVRVVAAYGALLEVAPIARDS